MFVIVTPHGFVKNIWADSTFSVTTHLEKAKVFSTYGEAENMLNYVVEGSYIVSID
jgi:hypothetical protein